MAIETINLLTAGTNQYWYGTTVFGATSTSLPHTVAFSGTNVFRYSMYGDSALFASLVGKVIRGYRLAGSLTNNNAANFNIPVGLRHGAGILGGHFVPTGGASGAKPFDFFASGSIPLKKIVGNSQSSAGWDGCYVRWVSSNATAKSVTLPSGFLTSYEVTVDDIPSFEWVGVPDSIHIGDIAPCVVKASYPSGEPIVGQQFSIQAVGSALTLNGGAATTVTTDAAGEAHVIVKGTAISSSAAFYATPFGNPDAYSVEYEYVNTSVVVAPPACFWADLIGVTQDCD